MLALKYVGMMGNQMFQYAWSRILARRLGYSLAVPSIEGFPTTADKITGIVRTGDWIHIQNKFCLLFEEVEELAREGRPLLVHKSHLENYSVLAPYRETIRTWFQFAETQIETMEFRSYRNGWHKAALKELTPSDLVINIRLGNYLRPNHQFRLLLYDYFSLILKRHPHDRLIVTSDSIDHPLLLPFASPRTFYLFAKHRWETLSLIRKASNVAISQSTFSWWAGYLSDAVNVYFPIPKTGVWTLEWVKQKGLDLRVREARYKYVDYQNGVIFPCFADAFPEEAALHGRVLPHASI